MLCTLMQMQIGPEVPIWTGKLPAVSTPASESGTYSGFRRQKPWLAVFDRLFVPAGQDPAGGSEHGGNDSQRDDAGQTGVSVAQ